MAGIQSGEGRMMIDSVVWAQYINVTDTQPRLHSNSRPNALRSCSKWIDTLRIESAGPHVACRRVLELAASVHPSACAVLA